jgi:hypothetical protein
VNHADCSTLPADIAEMYKRRHQEYAVNLTIWIPAMIGRIVAD